MQVNLPSKVVVAYDNMYNLAKLKVARNPLPFPPPLDKVWHNVDKIIDSYIKNHVSQKCRERFNLTHLKTENPDFNTQAGEQTFVWVGRFRHILCSKSPSSVLSASYGVKKLIPKSATKMGESLCYQSHPCEPLITNHLHRWIYQIYLHIHKSCVIVIDLYLIYI